MSEPRSRLGGRTFPSVIVPPAPGCGGGTACVWLVTVIAAAPYRSGGRWRQGGTRGSGPGFRVLPAARPMAADAPGSDSGPVSVNNSWRELFRRSGGGRAILLTGRPSAPGPGGTAAPSAPTAPSGPGSPRGAGSARASAPPGRAAVPGSGPACAGRTGGYGRP